MEGGLWNLWDVLLAEMAAMAADAALLSAVLSYLFFDVPVEWMFEELFWFVWIALAGFIPWNDCLVIDE